LKQFNEVVKDEIMEQQRKTYSQLIKKKLVLLIALIVIVIISLIMMILTITQNDQKQISLIDTLGKQRMLTQKIAKDSNYKLALLEIGGDTSLHDKLVDDIDLAMSDFEITLNQLEEGRILDQNNTIYLVSLRNDQIDKVIDDIRTEWTRLTQNVHQVITADTVDEDVLQASATINASNQNLLELSDELLQLFILNLKVSSQRLVLIALGIFTFALGLIAYAIKKLYTYMITPLNTFYNGIKGMGLNAQVTNIPTSSELKPVINHIHDGFDKLVSLRELIQNINQGASFDETLHYIYQSFSKFIPYTHIGIALLRDNGMLEASYGISDPKLKDLAKQMVGVKANIKNTSLGKIIYNGEPRVINDLETYPRNKKARYNEILLSYGIRSSIALPLIINQKPIGIIFFSSMEKNRYTDEHVSFLKIISSSIAISFNNTIFIDELLYSTLLALAKMAESRDENTGDHIDRMKLYSVKLAECLRDEGVYEDQITANFLKDLARFSPMHDIGKVGIPDGILLKPGKLTPEEFEKMKKHTVYGAEVLRTAEQNIQKHHRSLFAMGIEIAESHQEKWDGTGYPYQKKEYDIPLCARIVAVADVLDALTSKRPYKKAFTFEESFQIITDGKGSHFDPLIIDCISKHKNDFFEIYQKFQAE
jgi:HD-GYP domain-containing protein (c-di-GMP phosphodiesterase class II)